MVGSFKEGERTPHVQVPGAQEHDAHEQEALPQPPMLELVLKVRWCVVVK